ncbi:MAG: T9SS type A sorting domain-containing protein [Paludibacter sp.]|nr:T9SS type A sorting domain-containing protein [Paludibacter sp.]
MKTSRFAILQVLFIVSLGFLQAQQSTLVYPGTDGKLVYTPHANIGETNNVNIIPDFSFAGYMDGGVKVPVGEVPVKVTLNPTASGEDRTRIQAAIDQVCNMAPDANGYRGTVLLKKGTYRLNNGTIPNLNDGYGSALRIWASGVVLRGEGQGVDGTILYSDFATNHTMITVEPVSRGMSMTNAQTITDAYVGTGARTFTVANASGFAVGDLIVVRFTPNDTWFSDLKVTTGGFINDPADYWTVSGEREAYNINFKRKIIAKEGNTITIECPVVQPMQTKYGGGQILKYTTSGRLTKCGVEDLRIVGIEDGGSPSVSTNGNRLRAGIRPRFIDNSWVHGVTVTRTSEAAVITWDVMNITVEECAYIDPRGSISGGWRYSFCLDAQSTRVLFQRCYSDYGRHDFVTHARIPGPNVFLDCVSVNGLNILGPHHRWATGTLFDNIKGSSKMSINEYASSSGGHAWCGAQTVGWNLECASYVCDAALGSQNYLIGSIGNESQGAVSHLAKPGSVFRGYWEKSGPNGVHVATRSLYLKQLEDRLGIDAVKNITIPAQLTGNTYSMLSAWAGKDLLYSENIAVEDMEVLPREATVSKGFTKQLIASFSPWNASQKTVTWTSDNTAVATVSSTGLVTAIAIGNATINATTVDGSKSSTSIITVTPVPINKTISNCDANTGWTSSNTLTINSSDKKEGSASLQSVGASTDEFKKVFSPPINTGVTIATDNLQFWYYVSDVSLFSTNNQVELGSGGVADVNEYSWNIGDLVNGWNLITLPFSTANVMGTPDLSAINWFRLYRVKTGSVTTRIDNIEISNLTAVNNLHFNKNEISIYPNPVQNQLNIKSIDGNSKIRDLTLTDLNGKMLIRKTFNPENAFDYQLDVRSLNAGLYLLRITSDSKSETKKVCIER